MVLPWFHTSKFSVYSVVCFTDRIDDYTIFSKSGCSDSIFGLHRCLDWLSGCLNCMFIYLDNLYGYLHCLCSWTDYLNCLSGYKQFSLVVRIRHI